MPSRVLINGAVLAELREEKLWSHARLAKEARAFADGRQDLQCGVSRTQILAYEAARLDGSGRHPCPDNLTCLVGALEPTRDDLHRLLGRQPNATLADLTRQAKQEAKAEQQAESGTSNAKEPPVDRRQFAIKLPAAVAAYVALPYVSDPLRAEIDDVIGAYATSPPQQLLPRIRGLLDRVVRALREPMMTGVHRRLLVDGSEVAAEAGWMALLAGHPGEADAYFTQALKFASESGVDRARGCALASAANAYDDADPATALAMLQAATPLMGREGLAAKYVAMFVSEALTRVGHARDALRALDRAEAIEATDHGLGLYSGRGKFAGFTTAGFTAWSGRILALHGRAEEAVEVLGRALSAPERRTWYPHAMVLGDLALAHTVDGDPEPACHAAAWSLDASQAVGYRVGADRVRRVRAMMPESWSDTACVRELDERLRMLT